MDNVQVNWFTFIAFTVGLLTGGVIGFLAALAKFGGDVAVLKFQGNETAAGVRQLRTDFNGLAETIRGK